MRDSEQSERVFVASTIRRYAGTEHASTLVWLDRTLWTDRQHVVRDLAAHRLVTLRDAWLNPPEWSERVPEVVPLGMSVSPYPDRILAKPGFEKDLAKRTLTKLYSQRPAWLALAHTTLDMAVAAAYGWADYSAAMPDEEILRRLLALNLERAAHAPRS